MATNTHTSFRRRKNLLSLEANRFEAVRLLANTYWKTLVIHYSYVGNLSFKFGAIDGQNGLNLMQNYNELLVRETNYRFWLPGIQYLDKNTRQLIHPIQVIILFGWLLTLLSSNTYCQCRVTQDELKHIITICQVDNPTKESFLINRPDRGQVASGMVYLGSPYLTFPIYQAGTLEFAANQQVLRGKIAFNLVAQEVSLWCAPYLGPLAKLDNGLTLDPYERQKQT